MLNRKDNEANKKLWHSIYKNHWVNEYLTGDQVEDCIEEYKNLKKMGTLDKDISFDKFLTETIQLKK
tara:strand:- start:1372 stop:1572 length:201 start_codon:yes stop_codon:yes gene_type:complete